MTANISSGSTSSAATAAGVGRRPSGGAPFNPRPAYENALRLLEFTRPDNVIYTNLGQDGRIDTLLEEAGRAEWTEPERIIQLRHGRGRDELVHRALQDFRSDTARSTCDTRESRAGHGDRPIHAILASARFLYLIGSWLPERRFAYRP